jgi:hypothetical protein
LEHPQKGRIRFFNPFFLPKKQQAVFSSTQTEVSFPMERRQILRNALTALAAGTVVGTGSVLGSIGIAQAQPGTNPVFPHNWQETLARKTFCTVTYGEKRGDLLYAELIGPHNTRFTLYSPDGEHWYNTPDAIPHGRRISA